MHEYLAKAQRVIEIEKEAIDLLAESLGKSFINAVDMLKNTLANHGKIVVVGVGKSGNIGHKIAATLNSTGATAVELHSQNALHGDLGLISDGDCVIALSFSGETAELLDLMPHIKRADINLIAITGKPESTLAQHSDAALITPISREACPLNLAPTSSSTAALVMGDALAMVLLDARNFTDEEFARYHPGGSLGRALLTTVDEIMRSGKQLSTCSLTCTVLDAVTSMGDARCGACVILNDDQTLAGVFTHGDFARAFQSDTSIGSKPVREFMTQDPITVQSEALAAEAINTIGKHRIDDVVVLNAESKVVGIVDTQDFARQKLV